jgi:putative membrane protein
MFMRIILRIIFNAIALALTAFILQPRIQLSDNIIGIILVAIIFGFVNALLRPIVKFFSLPITCLTLGLYTLVINMVMLPVTALLAGNLLNFTGGFLENLMVAFVAAILISVISGLLNWLLPDKK